MADFNDILLRLSKRLYPKSRAWKVPSASDDSPPSGGFLERLHKALAKSENRAIQAALSVLDSTLPDNSNFDEEDAANWERCLGIYSAVGTTLADRKLAIKTKLNYPGTTAARQYYLYIQQVLRDAGFDVYVYENRFLEGSPPEYVTHTPGEVLGTTSPQAVYGYPQYGQVQYGQVSTPAVSKVANYVEESGDADFDIGDNYRSTFFIAGATIDTFADVDTVRKNEFRQLILQLKPQQTCAFLFINYI